MLQPTQTDQPPNNEISHRPAPMFQSLFEAAPNGIFAVDASGHIVLANPCAETMFEYRPGELIGKHVDDLIPDRFRESHDAHRHSYVQNPTSRVMGGRLEIYGRRSGGSEFPVDISLSSLRTHDSELFLAIVRDITERKQTERDRDRMAAVVVATDDAVIASDHNGRITMVNAAAEKMLGYTSDELTAVGIFDIVPPDRASDFAEFSATLERGDPVKQARSQFERKDGTRVDISMTLSDLHDGPEGKSGRVAVIRDISEIVALEKSVEAGQRRFRSMLQNITDVMIVVSKAAKITYISQSVETSLGYRPEDLLGQSIDKLVHPDDRIRTRNAGAQLRDPGSRVTEIRLRVLHAAGHWCDFEATLNPQFEDPDIAGMLITARDISERTRFEEQLSRRAFYDELTSLPNRSLFDDRLRQALARGARIGTGVAVMFLDLDNFKFINDSLGHSAGDKLLVDVAGRLVQAVRPQDTVARFGGDEFIIVLEGLQNAKEAELAAQRIITAMEEPFVLENRESVVSASVGIAFCPACTRTPEDFWREADIALYRAKNEGRARYAIFDSKLDGAAANRSTLEGELREAIDREEFVLHYQPQIDLESGAVAGAEALVRWNHPNRGLLLPAEFIAVAEETGLILAIDRWVLEEAGRRAVTWRRDYPDMRLTMSVNLSARRFWRADLVDEIEESIQRIGISPGMLKLEITETMILNDTRDTRDRLACLRELGVGVALDDFGTGFSALSHLRNLPIDTIKIDGSFVGALESDAKTEAIVRSITGLAKDLGMDVVAEGVETAAQLDQVRSVGCDHAQGYFIAKPLDAGAMADFLATRARRAA